LTETQVRAAAETPLVNPGEIEASRYNKYVLEDLYISPFCQKGLFFHLLIEYENDSHYHYASQ